MIVIDNLNDVWIRARGIILSGLYVGDSSVSIDACSTAGKSII